MNFCCYFYSFGIALIFLFCPARGEEHYQILELYRIEKERVLISAEVYLRVLPVTVTAFSSPRSAGGIHDYFSEGDYWWPDPAHPDGPYVQRDGETNPDNFIEHRRALIQFSVQAATLAAGYKLTGEEKYARHVVEHLRSWFINPSTKMNPHLLYAQAIKGKVTGRGIGIIDTIHLIEVVKAIEAIEDSPSWSPHEKEAVRKWFEEYLHWMTTHEYGIAEREAKNNHGTCWVFQVAAYAKFLGNDELIEFCRNRFKSIILPTQMDIDGSFPLELKRTKPYGYSLFNLEAMAGICKLLSTREDNLWEYRLPDGRMMKKAMEFMVPFIQDKNQWTYPPDVMYHDQWPIRHSSLLFAGLAYHEQRYIDLWKTLNPDPTVEEIIRNFPIRQPLLWIPETTEYPSVRLIDPAVIFHHRKKYFIEGESSEYDKIRRLAEKALKQPAGSVIDKMVLPPSGDKHDYFSLAPYWWPDTTKSDGLPYIRRDGERNPERNTIGDREKLGDMMASVRNLAYAYYITNYEPYAEHAVLLLRGWFLEPDTRMNPNLNFAQAVRGVNDGRSSGIIDTYGFREVIDAIQLLRSSTSWRQSDDKGLHQWFSNYLLWLLESNNGKKEAETKNNHGTLYAVQVVAIAQFLGEDSLAKKILLNIPARIASQIEPDGTEPYELARTKSWGYSLFNLEGLFELATLGERYGLNLWQYSTEDGRCIRKTLDWLTPYALGEKEWTYKQIVPLEKERLYPILRMAAIKYKNASYLDAAIRIPGIKDIQAWTNLFHP